MTEHEQFSKALAAWMESQNVSPGIAVPALLTMAGTAIGNRARKGEVEDFSTGLASCQNILQYTALATWVNK